MEHQPTKRHLKQVLRRSIKELILGLDPEVRAVEQGKLIALFPALPGYASAQTVLLFFNAFAEEIDTHPLFHVAKAAGKRVVCPRAERAEKRMRLFEVRSLTQDLEPGLLGIPEPCRTCREVDLVEVDWALIPGLAFDSRCYRLGRGAGYYDRLLPGLRPEASCWALAFDCQIIAELPVESHDVPLDGVATPGRILERKSAIGSISVP